MVEHERIGNYPTDAPAFKIPGMEPDYRPAPMLGEHNEMICKELLKMSEAEYLDLLNGGIFS